MGGFKKISEDKNTIIRKIISDQELCKAVFYNESNFLDQPDIEPTSQLVYRNIFPHYFVPSQSENDDENTKKTYITLSFKEFRQVNGYYKFGKIYISVFTNKYLFRTDYGILRTDFIIDKIDQMLNRIAGISVGRLQFYMMDELYIGTNYSGNYLVYRTYDIDQ